MVPPHLGRAAAVRRPVGLGAVIGAAGSADSDERARVAEDQRAVAVRQRDAARDRASAAEATAHEAESQARASAADARARAESGLGAKQAELDERSAELDERAAALDAREDDLVALENELRSQDASSDSSPTGGGVDPVVPDTPPGTDPRFGTCKEAKANGYGMYRQGVDPEYDWYRDADGDGVVCE